MDSPRVATNSQGEKEMITINQGGRLSVIRSLFDVPQALGVRSRFGERARIGGHEGAINVLGILYNPMRKKGGILWGVNIVTDAGDLHVAQKWAAESPTNAFGIWELGTAGDAPAKGSNRSNMTSKVSGSQKAHDSTYPKRNDGDTDNTGAGVDIVTFRVSYTTAEANSAGITRGIITNVTPGASEPVLSYWTITSFEKTSSDTLKMFLNEQLNGV